MHKYKSVNTIQLDLFYLRKTKTLSKCENLSNHHKLSHVLRLKSRSLFFPCRSITINVTATVLFNNHQTIKQTLPNVFFALLHIFFKEKKTYNKP